MQKMCVEQCIDSAPESTSLGTLLLKYILAPTIPRFINHFAGSLWCFEGLEQLQTAYGKMRDK